MLAGHPFAGKSMLVSGLLRALETGEPFLGRKTKTASALLVTEEDQASLRERAGRFGLFGIRSEYLDRSLSVGHEWSALIAGATERALAKQHRLLVIDTFPGLAGLGDEQENDAGAITSRLQPLQVAAGQGLAVLFLHHMNNANQPRGSKAFRGVVDTSIRFLRKVEESQLQAGNRNPLHDQSLEKPEGGANSSLGGLVLPSTRRSGLDRSTVPIDR